MWCHHVWSPASVRIEFPRGKRRRAPRGYALWCRDFRMRLGHHGLVGVSRKKRYARRRKRRMDRVSHDLSDAQWDALKVSWGGCAYCRAPNRAMQRDCVLPIANGGRYTLGNVVPVCRSCNASKCNEEVVLWLRRRRYDERGFLLRHLAITKELEERFREQEQDAG